MLYGKSIRDFNASWFQAREWLEFSISKKVAFCFCCWHYLARNSTTANYDPSLITSGYSNWKHALEKNKGFNKHEVSSMNVKVLSLWKEQRIRISTNQSASTLVNDDQLVNNRYYVKSIAKLFNFCASMSLPLRGHNSNGIITLDESSDDEPSGLFIKLLEYTLLKDEKLRSAFASIPKNAIYTSPTIQNEMIETLKETVLEKVVADIKVSDINWFTLKADITRDPTNVENVSVVIKFVKLGKAYESLIGLPLTEKFDAGAITSVRLDCINSCGIDPKKMISQCYDGAAVMSGTYGGVQKKIQETLN